MQKQIIAILLSLCYFSTLSAQTDTSQVKRFDVFGLPIVFLTPETSWGFGGAGILTFRFKGEAMDSRPSQIQLGGAYTLEDQILAYLPFQLFINDRTFNISGELGYYRYNYFFFGIGNEFEDYEGELFGVTYPRLRLNALYQVRPSTYVGIRYWMDDYDITETEEGGLLRSEDITGQQGGLISALGLVAQYDNRDQIFYPTKGWLAELAFLNNGAYLGSPFEFVKYTLDVSHYHSFNNLVLALNAYIEWNEGDIPFNQLGLIGGTKRMRGYYEGRYRDEKLGLLQTELRFPLFWRFGGVVFGGLGWVADSFSAFESNNTRYTFGAGLRILLQKRDHVNVRIDYGLGKNTSGVYITVGEAF